MQISKYHTFWRRFWAGIVDALVFIPVMVIDSYIDSPERGKVLFVLWSTVSMSSYFIYSVILHWKYGQTLGKRLCEVKVLDVSEDRGLTLAQSLWRDVGYIATQALTLLHIVVLVVLDRYSPAAAYIQGFGALLLWAGMLWVLVDLITMLTNHKRRSLHDLIAKTVVVRVA